MKSQRTLSRATATKTTRTVRRISVTRVKSHFVEKDRLVEFLKNSQVHWRRIEAHSRPQGISTMQSMVAAGKAMIINDIIESIETEDYLQETWEEDD